MKYERLFQPITINGMELRNRLVMPPINTHYTTDGNITDRICEFYNRRAEGGVGLIVLGGCRFNEYGGLPTMPSFDDDKYLPGFKKFTDGLHERGAKVSAQLYNTGAYIKALWLKDGVTPKAPSDIICKFTKEPAYAMTEEDIKEDIKLWGEAAARVKAGGFDAVELVGSAGYLICQFLSPLTNKRTDKYGGSFENRLRYPLEVIAEVRRKVGPDFPIIIRVSGNDFVEGSNNNEAIVEVAKAYEKAGIDMLSVTGGWHETVIPQLTGEVPRGGFGYLSEAIKKAVSIPVVSANRYNDPDVAELALAMGKGDLIGVGRTLVADPDWCNKAKDGNESEIRHCLGCNQGCLARSFFGQSLLCLTNAFVGEPTENRIPLAEIKKNILVVGAGPGGLEAAYRCAERGHAVTIWEKQDSIGGLLPIVAAPPGKQEFTTLIDFYKAMIKKYNIKLETGKCVTAEDVINAKFDEVIIATGSTPNFINFKTDDAVKVVTAEDVLAKRVFPGKNIVVVGGSSVGCETAQYLARQGSLSEEGFFFLNIHKAETPEKINSMLNSSSRTVAVIEIAKKMGAGFDAGGAWPVMKDLKRLGVSRHTLTHLVEVKDGIAYAEKTTPEGGVEKLEFPCDTLVLAVGYHSNNALYEELNGKVNNLHIIGSAGKVGNALNAIKEAADLAITL